MDAKDINNNDGQKKQAKEQQKLKSQTGQMSQNAKLIRDLPKFDFPSIVYENGKVAYLTRSAIEKLLEQPESFEDKIKGAFVCVKLNDINKLKTCKIVQVTGVTKTSTKNDRIDTKLQTQDVEDSISIDMLSNAYLSKEQCEDLRNQMKDGPFFTLEELQQKVISLHENIIDEAISREVLRLRAKMERAYENGRKQEYIDFKTELDHLEISSTREQLVNNFLKVIADVQTFSKAIFNEKEGKHSSTELISNEAVECDDITIKLEKDVTILNNQVWGQQYTDEELLKFSDQYHVEMFLVRREIMRRFENKSKEQRSFNIAEHQKLEMNLIEANRRLSIAEEELKEFKKKIEEDAQESVSKIHKMEQDAHSNEINVRNMEKQAELSAAKLRKLEDDALLNFEKIRKFEEDSKENAAKLRKMEEIEQLSRAKIRKMEEDAHLAAIKIRKLEDDVKLSDEKIRKMENDAHLSSTTIETLKSGIITMHQEHIRQIEVTRVQSATEALSRFKQSKVFVEEYLKILQHIFSAGWTECLQKIKELVPLPNLNFGESQKHIDPNAWEKVDLHYHNFTHSPIQLEQLYETSDLQGLQPVFMGETTSHF